MTHLGHWPASHVAAAKPVSAPIRALILADTMLPPEAWGEHEAAGFSQRAFDQVGT
jgi:hypothetical protein